jgi:glycerol-3-phosphate O-acyltransferase
MQEGYDPQYAKRIYEGIEKRGGHKMFFKELHTKGIENIKENSGRRRLYLGNHLSNADALVVWYTFHKYGIKMPMTAAGANLNIGLLKMIGIDLSRLGAFWTDREKIGDRDRENISGIGEKIDEILSNGNDIFAFPEGGRSYNGKLFEKYKTGIIKKVLQREKDIEIVPFAIDYSRRIEEGFFKYLEKVKEWKFGGKQIYIALDLLALTKEYFGKKEKEAYINFGRPTSLEKITDTPLYLPETIQAVKGFSMGKTNELFQEIQEMKNK